MCRYHEHINAVKICHYLLAIDANDKIKTKTKTNQKHDFFIRAIVAQDVISAAMYQIVIVTVGIIPTGTSVGAVIIEEIGAHHRQNPFHHHVTAMLTRVHHIDWKSVHSVNICSGLEVH